MPRPLRLLHRNLVAQARRYIRPILLLSLLALLESTLHISSFRITPPPTPLDAPFHRGCNPTPNLSLPRANATILMLARNSDVAGAAASMRSLEQQFNARWRYPVLFLNDEPFDERFKARMREEVSGGDVRFEVIPSEMWGWPEWVDRKRAKSRMRSMEDSGIVYAGRESYHHMCRFNSGFFYDHPALKEFRWYWRVEPDVRFTCEISYDPFREMEQHGKKYGYTVALWELGTTIPSLFRKISDYKKRKGIPTTSLWTAMMDPSWAPWPIRRFLALLRNRDANGDLYNMCHFWSNFEIADMEFFRSKEYRDLFEFLDQDGGFYYERWGDAPIHSLAAGLLLEPRELHHFSDFGYIHDKLQYCTYADSKGLTLDVVKIEESGKRPREEDRLGCNCICDRAVPVLAPVCINKIKSAVL